MAMAEGLGVRIWSVVAGVAVKSELSVVLKLSVVLELLGVEVSLDRVVRTLKAARHLAKRRPIW